MMCSILYKARVKLSNLTNPRAGILSLIIVKLVTEKNKLNVVTSLQHAVKSPVVLSVVSRVSIVRWNEEFLNFGYEKIGKYIFFLKLGLIGLKIL